MSYIKLEFAEWLAARSSLAERILLKEVQFKGADSLNLERIDGLTGLDVCYDLAEHMLVKYSAAPDDYAEYIDFMEHLDDIADVPAVDTTKMN